MSRMLMIGLLVLVTIGNFGIKAGAAEKPAWWDRAWKKARHDGYTLVSTDELKALYASKEKYLVVDARPRYEYNAGHLPEAVQFEFDLSDRSRLRPEKKKQLLGLLGPDKNRRVIIYCRIYSWMRSEIAAYWAVRLGYQRVYRYPSGYLGWLEETCPEDKERKSNRRIRAGDPYPACRLTPTGGAADRTYLHVTHNRKCISLADIGSDFILIAVYHELCLTCRQELQELKQVYHWVRTSPEMNQLAIIGIGVGSEPDGIVKFRQDQRIPYPLFADSGWEIFHCLGNPLLPTSYIIHRISEGGWTVLTVHEGHLGNSDSIKQRIRKTLRPAGR